MTVRAALLLVAVSTLAQAQESAPVERLREVEEEHSRVAHWLRQVESETGDVLAVLDALEKEVLAANALAATAGDTARQEAQRLAEAKERETDVARRREALAVALGPRLALRYRLSGARPLEAMLANGSVGDFLWRRRMVDRVLADDLALAQTLSQLAREAATSRAEVANRMEASERAQQEAALRADEAQQRQEQQQAVLAGLKERKGAYTRMVVALEEARSELLETIASMPPPAEGLGGFGARRGNLSWPVKGEIEQGFGLQTDARFGTHVQHKGLDLRAARGDRVFAPHPASVGYAGWFRGYGNLIVLDHGEGYYTLYAHLDALAVERGQQLEQGAELGRVGSTGSLKGAFLYFEIRSGAKALDPTQWLAPR